MTEIAVVSHQAGVHQITKEAAHVEALLGRDDVGQARGQAEGPAVLGLRSPVVKREEVEVRGGDHGVAPWALDLVPPTCFPHCHSVRACGSDGGGGAHMQPQMQQADVHEECNGAHLVTRADHGRHAERGTHCANNCCCCGSVRLQVTILKVHVAG